MRSDLHCLQQFTRKWVFLKKRYKLKHTEPPEQLIYFCDKKVR